MIGRDPVAFTALYPTDWLVLAYEPVPALLKDKRELPYHAGSDYPARLKRVKHAISRAAAAGSVKGPEGVADFAHRLLTLSPARSSPTVLFWGRSLRWRHAMPLDGF